MTNPNGDSETTKDQGSRLSDWTPEDMRALLLPLAGLIGLIFLVALGACANVDKEVLIPAITAVVTLTASAAGHAAGSAKSKGRGGG